MRGKHAPEIHEGNGAVVLAPGELRGGRGSRSAGLREQAILDPLHASIEIGDHADLSLGEKPHLLEHRLLLGPEPAHDQDDAVAHAELVKLAQAESGRGVHALHHAEIEDEVAHPVPNDQVAAGLHQAAREGEEQIALQAEGASASPLLLENGRGLEVRSLLER